MEITITSNDLKAALGTENKWFLSKYIKNVQQALAAFHLAKNSPVLAPTTRQTLVTALYEWKNNKTAEFNKYDNIGGGAVRKLCVQCGFDDYRPPPPSAVFLAGANRPGATQRAEPTVTPLTTDVVHTLRDYAADNKKIAVLVIDLYGDDFEAQGLNSRYGASPATVKDNIKLLLNNTRVQIGTNTFEHLPVYICAKSTTPKGSEAVGEFANAITSCYREIIISKTNSVLHETELVDKLKANTITDVFVTGFDANMCVASSIFGSGHKGPMYQRGLMDHGFNVVTSRFILASGGNSLRGQDGWPYMGRCNL